MKPTRVPMTEVTKELGDPSTWDADDQAYATMVSRRSGRRWRKPLLVAAGIAAGVAVGTGAGWCAAQLLVTACSALTK